MLLRFCNLCNKSIDQSFVTLKRYYRTASNVQMKQKNFVDETPEERNDRIPIITCKRAEFNFYKGQTYSKYDTIPLASKGWLHRKSRHDYFTIHPIYNEEEDVSYETDTITSFNDFGLNPCLLDKMAELEITEPLRIQKEGIPLIMDGHNTILAAETGCGKTLTYLLPMINNILDWKTLSKRGLNMPLGLIITPTRELAVQIGLETLKLSKDFGIKTKIITGGKTKKLMREYPLGDVDIIVASFGVISKLTTNRIYDLTYVRHVVLDEADALFHETFLEKVNVFMRRLPISVMQTVNENGFPENAQLTLASATMPSRTAEALHNVLDIDSLRCVSTNKLHRILVPQKFIRLSNGQKPVELLKYVKPKVANKQPVIIFSNENNTCDWLSMFLNECGIKTVHLNGTMSVKHRSGKYAEFRSGRCNVLSTTNAGSRGLDTVMVNHVLNYEFPLSTADYIHRCGRTGRVGTKGVCLVTNFVSRPLEIQLVQKIERATRKMKPIPIIDMLSHGADEEEMLIPEEEAEPYVERIIEDLEEEDSIPY